jgi:hypothetical protein
VQRDASKVAYKSMRAMTPTGKLDCLLHGSLQCEPGTGGQLRPQALSSPTTTQWKRSLPRRAGFETTCKQATKVYEIDERTLSNCCLVLGNQADAKHRLLQRFERGSVHPRMTCLGRPHPERSPMQMIRLTMRFEDWSVPSPRDATGVTFRHAFQGSVHIFLSAFRSTSWLLAYPLAPTVSVKAIYRCTLIASPSMAACKSVVARA